MKNSNLLWAVVISMAFVVFWDAVVVSRFKPKTPPKPVIASEAKQSAVPEQKNQIASVAPLPRNDTSPKTITLKTAALEVVAQNEGAAISNWRVQEEDGDWVELVRKPVLVTLPALPWFTSSPSEKTVSFTTDHPEGFRLAKTLTLEGSAPFHTLSVAVTNRTKEAKTVTLPLLWNGGFEKRLVRIVSDDKVDEAALAEVRIVAYRDRPQSWRAGFIRNRKIDTNFSGPFTWVGIDNHHFLAALLPKEGTIETLHVMADRDNPPAFEVPLTFSLAPGETKSQAFDLYVGPKHYKQLDALGRDLDHAVDFGTFGILAKGLLRALEFFKGMTHNYGWAIVLLTIMIQILVFPLTKKSLSHSVRMKELQPQIKQIQEQFKSDPKRMQVEMFNIYRKNGMKFMGMEGCFPILLQLPIFFAFYTTLNVAYELRGASWLWIPDLGLHDPKYILPILMGAGMFVQQKMTTVAADPAQAKMMMFMPVIMIFMFWKLPAGLVLYWTVNSICTILIQQLLQWRQHAKPSSQ